MAASRPLIAIVGRPNVGKSRLFNRLTRSRDAIVEDTPGVTRDRHYGDGEWDGGAFSIVDTGGFEPDSEDVLLGQMREQAQLAIDEAEIVFFVTDGRAGLTPIDEEIARLLRAADKLLFPIVNKIDGPRHELLVAEFYAMGFEKIYPVSAEHGYMLGELMDDVVTFLPSLDKVRAAQADEGGPLKLAVIGKPNAGKSTLINRVLGEERLLTSDIPGTTRDAIDNLIVRDEREYLFIDTAGVRRRRSISQLIEKYAVVKAFKSVDRANVVIYMIDGSNGLHEQDKRLIRLIHDKGRPHVLLINKWDKVEKDSSTAGTYAKDLLHQLDYVDYAPMMFISALTGQRVHKVFKLVEEVYEAWSQRVPTSPLNRWLEYVQKLHSPPVYKRRPVKLFFMTQVAVRPPTFMITANYPDAVAPSYRRYLLNRLREDHGFGGTPLKIFFRPRKARQEFE